MTMMTKRKVFAVSTLAAVGIGAAACGGSSSGSASPATSSSPSTGSSSSASASGLAAAQAFVAKYSQPPTTLGQTIPLKSKPTAGKTFIFLQCELPQCAENYQAIQAATSAVGWHAKAINFNSGDPATFLSAMKQALTDKPYAISFTVPPYQVWSSEVPAYTKAGVIIIPSYVGATPINATIISNIAGPDHTNVTGKLVGDWFVSDSQGKGHALVVNVPAIGVLQAFSTSLINGVKADCPNCKLTNLNASTAQLGSNGVTPAIVSALQRDPSIKYVLLADGAFEPGLPAALKAAGLNGIKIAGGGASIENESDVKNGTESAFVSEPLTIAGWVAVDAALRHSEHMTVTGTDGDVPVELVTKQNVGTPSAELNLPANYAAQFKKLWKVS